jgi:hypothetical protein
VTPDGLLKVGPMPGMFKTAEMSRELLLYFIPSLYTPSTFVSQSNLAQPNLT